MRATIALMGCLVLLGCGPEGDWHDYSRVALGRHTQEGGSVLICRGEVEKAGVWRTSARQAVFDGCMANLGFVKRD